MNDFSSLGENLKAIRDKRGLNLNNVSELTEISKVTPSKIEHRESVPTVTTVWKIANGLKVTLNVLAGEIDNNYAVRDVAKTTPLINGSRLFTLYNTFPLSPLGGIQVSYGVFKAGHYYDPSMLIHKSSDKEYCIVFRGELDMVIGPRTYHLFEGCGIDSDAHEEHSYINYGTSETVVCFLLI